ncbi:hypothetical protein [Nostoc sp. CHAB 5715]|uniref:hypothetical protein n=1 Tax=Nostoc sp. CHAB 5715 TaxID=2780400 RepID=UPI001E386BFE|nr:hypothetical protein [Nostoc sp. CHAB 5715]MCC5621061.1 hypothetical protein [Nostoc sp. CHAB 5715]
MCNLRLSFRNYAICYKLLHLVDHKLSETDDKIEVCAIASQEVNSIRLKAIAIFAD